MSEFMRILIVDDQPRARQGLRALLETLPCCGEIEEAASGEEGLQVAAEFKPDLMLIDVLMPGMDGLQATRAVKERWPQVRVIVLSMSSEFRQAALQAGAEAFLTKGDAPEMLLETVEAVALGPPLGKHGVTNGGRDSGDISSHWFSD